MPKAKGIRANTKAEDDKNVSNILSSDSLSTEEMPVPPQKEQASLCVLCRWFEKRLEDTMKEHVRHMTKYHLD